MDSASSDQPKEKGGPPSFIIRRPSTTAAIFTALACLSFVWLRSPWDFVAVHFVFGLALGRILFLCRTTERARYKWYPWLGVMCVFAYNKNRLAGFEEEGIRLQAELIRIQGVLVLFAAAMIFIPMLEWWSKRGASYGKPTPLPNHSV